MNNRIYIEKFSELQAGDILLFRNDHSSTGTLLSIPGIFLSKSKGHYDTIHAAICLESSKTNPMIAHVTGHNIMGYTKESIMKAFMGNHLIDRPFLVFRPRNTDIANQIAEVASDTRNYNVKWKKVAAFKAFFTIATIHNKEIKSSDNKKTKNISNSSFCSKFVIECIKKAALDYKDGVNYYPRIRSTVIPKTLESYLYNHPDYLNCIYPGIKPYNKIKQVIESEITRLTDECNNVKKYQRLSECCAIFVEITEKMKQDSSRNHYEKTLFLLKIMLPKFYIGTSFFPFSKAYNNIISAARDIGIFLSDIQSYPIQLEDQCNSCNRSVKLNYSRN